MRRLAIGDLQRLVDRTIDEERVAEALRAEIRRTLSPAVIADGPIARVIREANERLDVLAHTGRRVDIRIPSGAFKHGDPGVRMLAAKVAPIGQLRRLMNDRDPSVRAAVALRLPSSAVSEMMRKFPRDDQLRSIVRQKHLKEAEEREGTTAAVFATSDDPFDMNGDERLGRPTKQDPGPELSQLFYDELALKFMLDYGDTIEDSWDAKLVQRYTSSVRVTSGVDIDPKKLLDSIRALMTARDDRAMARSPLKETVAWLDRRERRREKVLPIVEFKADPVRTLIEGRLTSSEYVGAVNELFSVEETKPHSSLVRVHGADGLPSTVPVVGRLPHDRGFRAIDEVALDAYCERWSERCRLSGGSLVLEWCTNPDDAGRITFSVSAR